MGGNDLFTFNAAAAVSNIRNPSNRPRSDGEDPAVYHPRILNVKSQRIIYVIRKTEIVKDLAKKSLDGNKVRNKGKKNIAAGYSSVRGLSLGLVGLGLGLAGVELTAGGFYGENVVDITVTPVFSIFNAKHFLGPTVLNKVIAARLYQYNANIRI